MLTTWQRTTIALTGTIGSGKTTVSSIFEDLGAFVVNADQLAKQAVAKGSPSLATITDHFGLDFLNPDGSLNRRLLGQAVFSNSQKLTLLNSIVHPQVAKLAKERFTSAQAKKAPLRIYDVPLFFENKLYEQNYKSVIVVSAPASTCLERIKKRNNLNDSEIQARIASQISIEEKVKRADIVIENNGTLEELKEKVHKIYNLLP